MEKKTYPLGLKWTRQRKDVYDVLKQAGEPLSAVQIYNHIEKNEQTQNYALSTIYRILAAFEEQELVTKTNWMGDGTIVYELNRGEHTHYAVCLSCNKRVALKSCPFAHVHFSQDSEQDMDDFHITAHKLELYGYCKQCEEQQK